MPEFVRASISRWLDSHRYKRAQRLLAEREPARARVVCIASGKGGTGKSILASNLSVLRALRGERVLLVDFDAGFANDHLLLGLTPEYDLAHVLDGEVDAEQALVDGPGGLKLLSGGVGRYGLANPTRRELDRLFKALVPLEQRFDLILVDQGAGLNYASTVHLAASHVLLLVTGCELTALSDAYAVYKRALSVNPAIETGLVINRALDEDRARSAWERFQGAAERFLYNSPEYLGHVLDDRAVPQSVEQRSPVSLTEPGSPAAAAFQRISCWPAIDRACNGVSFYDRARRTLR